MAESKRNRTLVILKGKILSGLLLICALLFILLRYAAIEHRKSFSFNQQASALVESFHDAEKKIEKFVTQHPELFGWKISNASATEELKQLSKGIDLQVYESDSLVFWTSMHNQVHSINAFASKGVQLVRQKNGWFGVIGMNDPKQTVRHAVFIIPILNDYEINNRYLQDGYLLSPELLNHVELALSADSTSLPLTDIHDNQIGWIKENTLRYETPLNTYSVLSDVLLIIISLLLIFLLYVWIQSKTFYPLSIIGLIISLLSLRLLLPLFWTFDGIKATELFSPNVYASDYWNSSLGVVLLQAALIFLSSFLMFRNANKFLAYTANKKIKSLLWLVPWIWFLLLWPLSSVFHDLILNSVISIEVQNIYSINRISFAILILIVGSIFSFILFSNLILEAYGKNLPVSKRIKLVYFLGVGVLFLIFWLTGVQRFANLLVISSSLIYVLSYLRFSNSFLFKNQVSKAFVILLFSSTLTGFYTEDYSHEKGIQQAETRAGLFGDDRDYVAEYTFTDVHCRVTEDPIVKSALTGDKNLLNRLESRLSALYFRGYLGRYDVELGVYNQDSTAMLVKDSTQLSEILKYEGNLVFETSDIYLYFIESNSGTYYYDALVPVTEDTNTIGYLRFKMLPRLYTQTAVYPELLLGNAIRNQVNLKGANYAVYKDSTLYKYEGDFSFPKKYTFNPIDSIGQSKVQKSKAFSYVVYRTKRNKYVVVPVAKPGFLHYVSRVASMFALLALFWILGLILKTITSYVVSKKNNDFSYWSFSDRLNFLMILILVVSFVSVAFVISLYFNEQYSKNHKELLLKKHKEVINILQEKCRLSNQNVSSPNRNEFFKYLIPALADEKEIDINVFDPNGKLLISSRPSIFEKNLIGLYMNPEAFIEIKKADYRILLKEAIGSLKFLSVYEAIYDEEGNVLAIIQIPFFSQAENLQKDISRFLVALINVFIPILMLSVFISLLISNSVTEPIVRVGNKLSSFRLGKKNERIEWNRKDEIGILVEEYNALIEKLENSAMSLAKSEREGAWKEMAKQIAHEIKNPLTPMKLSIQLLKKATEEGRGDTKELIQRTSVTLIEQIDHLSEIATAFSNFAKMPEPELAKINLIQAMNASVNLFKENEQQVSILLKSEVTEAFVLADDTQLLSVFNNILQNAIQAIPEHTNGEVIVQLLELNNEYCIQFIDNGQGIPEEIQRKDFRRARS